jgi:hypothetical protein
VSGGKVEDRIKEIEFMRVNRLVVLGLKPRNDLATFEPHILLIPEQNET